MSSLKELKLRFTEKQLIQYSIDGYTRSYDIDDSYPFELNTIIIQFHGKRLHILVHDIMSFEDASKLRVGQIIKMESVDGYTQQLKRNKEVS